MSKPYVSIYTDGSCNHNERGSTNTGGFCAILRFGEVEKIVRGGLCNTTNNRMELLAIISGIEALKVPCNVLVYTDSQYAINVLSGYRKFLKGFMPKAKTKNKDLILRFALSAYQHEVVFEFIKGHNGHSQNEQCDEVAAQASRQATDIDHACFDSEAANRLIQQYSNRVLFYASK